MTEKVFLIGLDGATWDLIRPWIEGGELPTLASFLTDGAYGTLHSTVPSNTPVAIPALYTGCDPSITGSFNFTRPDGTPVALQEIDGPKIWDVLAEFDRTSCIVNVRTTHPPDTVNGVMISGPPTPGKGTEYSYPTGKAADVAFYPEAETNESRFHDNPYEQSEEMVQTFTDGMSSRFSSFMSLVSEQQYDFNMFWFGRIDSLQHWLWGDHESLLSLYKEIDTRIGKLLDLTDAHVFIVSDHGFEQMATRRFHVNEWLRREGHLSVIGGSIGNSVLSVGQSILREHLSGSTLKRVLSILPTEQSETETGESIIDRSRSNVPGTRDDIDAVLATKWGIDVLAPKTRREIVREEIIDGLSSLEDTEGNAVVRFVGKAENVFSEGPYLDNIPDIVFQLNTPYFAEGGLSEKVFSEMRGKVATQESGNRFNGWHAYDRDGIWMAKGPDMASGRTFDAEITDLVPTTLHMLDTPIPETMTGEVMWELFAADSKVSDRAKRTFAFRDKKYHSELSEADREAMYEQLEDMGYK